MIKMKTSITSLSSFSSTKSIGEKFKKNYPKVYQQIYCLKNGTSRFFKESLTFLKLKYRLFRDRSDAENFTAKEIEIYRQVPRDWQRVGPTIVVASFPFLQYIILPIAYMFPHKLLCHQFWSIEQKLKFGELDHLKKIALHAPILDDLLIHADKHLTDKDTTAKYEIIDLVKRINNQSLTNIDEILNLNNIFKRKEFNLNKLSEDHLKKIALLNNCKGPISFNNAKNLESYALWLARQDKKLLNEDFNNTELEFIYNIGFERGINSGMNSREDVIKKIRLWLEFSQKLNNNNENYSTNNNNLFLHSKIFFKNIYYPQK